jgi:hypothetical protein
LLLCSLALGLALPGSSQAAAAKVVWLCKLGQHPDPCTPGRSTTVYSPTLQPLRVEHLKQVKHPTIAASTSTRP